MRFLPKLSRIDRELAESKAASYRADLQAGAEEIERLQNEIAGLAAERAEVLHEIRETRAETERCHARAAELRAQIAAEEKRTEAAQARASLRAASMISAAGHPPEFL